jgi:hypothetical protein
MLRVFCPKGRHLPISIAGRRVEIGFKAYASPVATKPARCATERAMAAHYEVACFKF